MGSGFVQGMSMKYGTRHISRLTRQTQALVLAGGRGSRLKMLTDWRAKPAAPFGGQFRIIDFTLSNCLQSNIRRVSVLTQYKSHSLIRHLMRGWNRLNTDFGYYLDIIPAQQWLDEESWYSGTANAVYQCLDIIESNNLEYTLILAGDHIYKMDYGEMLAAHDTKEAHITVACDVVPIAEAKRFGVMEVDEKNRIIGFEEKPDQPKSMPNDPDHALVSLGLYAFNSDNLSEALERDAEDPDSSHDFGKDIIPAAVRAGQPVYAFPLHKASPGRPYWRDVGTIDAYFQAHMELLDDEPVMDLNDPAWPIYTKLMQSPPPRFKDHGPEGGCLLIDSIVSNGCVVSDSRLNESILSSDCEVGRGCDLNQVVALPECQIKKGCRLNRVVLDNGCILEPGTVIGHDPDQDARRFYVTKSGVVVVNREMLGQERRYQPIDV